VPSDLTYLLLKKSNSNKTKKKNHFNGKNHFFTYCHFPVLNRDTESLAEKFGGSFLPSGAGYKSS
jgi:hypothetical protein